MWEVRASLQHLLLGASRTFNAGEFLVFMKSVVVRNLLGPAGSPRGGREWRQYWISGWRQIFALLWYVIEFDGKTKGVRALLAGIDRLLKPDNDEGGVIDWWLAATKIYPKNSGASRRHPTPVPLPPKTSCH